MPSRVRMFPAAARTPRLVVCLLLSVACVGAQSSAPQAFPSARQAAQALAAAARSNDTAALLTLFGADAKDLVSSGDDVADRNDRASFVKAYELRHALVAAGPGRYTLTVGSSDWPLPIPLVKQSAGWVFDADAGKQEVLLRRIGRNELEAIRVSRALLDAEKVYAATAHDGEPAGVYTRKLRSDPGKENGLYWEAHDGEPESPGGPFLADAAGDGYELGLGKHEPFHGYFFRILTAQGSHARGGPRDYVVDGKLKRGFAIVAYPAEYGASGVMTFIINQRGLLYQKDLGEGTAAAAKAMTAFDPDPTWKAVE